MRERAFSLRLVGEARGVCASHPAVMMHIAARSTASAPSPTQRLHTLKSLPQMDQEATAAVVVTHTEMSWFFLLYLPPNGRRLGQSLVKEALAACWAAEEDL